MILDRTWNKYNSTFTISYTNKLGKREIWQKQLQYIKTYEYDEDGDCMTWDGKRCKKVYKNTMGENGYVPNEFDLLEYMYELPKDFLDQLHALYFPEVYFFDIETRYVRGEFPEPFEAKHAITTISLVSPKFDVIVYGWKPLSENGLEKYKERYLKWIDDNEYAKKMVGLTGKEPKVLYQKFDSEEEMIRHFLLRIVPQVPVLSGWNNYRFDWTYIVNRARVLFGEREMRNLIKNSSPTKEIGKIKWAETDGTKYKVIAPSHTVIIDYMEMVKAYDYSINPKESFSLDWISNASFGAHKIKYDGDLEQLYSQDYDWYVFYNAIDSLLCQLIHHKMKSVESPCSSGSITLVPLLEALGQVALTTANIFREFYEDDRHVVFEKNEGDKEHVKYEGAFCGCLSGFASWMVCLDFSSLYPSQIITCNLSPESIITKPNKEPWTEEELDNFRKDKNYFVSVMGNVYKNDRDYAFKRMQQRLMENRKFYKYTGQRLESELLTEIDRLIEGGTNLSEMI